MLSSLINTSSSGTDSPSGEPFVDPLKYYQQCRLISPEIIRACHYQTQYPFITLMGFLQSYFQAIILQGENDCTLIRTPVPKLYNANAQTCWRFRGRSDLEIAMNGGKEITATLHQITYFIYNRKSLGTRVFNVATFCHHKHCCNYRHLYLMRSGDRRKKFRGLVFQPNTKTKAT